MAKRALYLPLFAKAQRIFGLPAIFVCMVILYPQRKKEADAYARSPVCAAGATDITTCRRMATGKVVRSKCRKDFGGTEVCELELQVDEKPAFIELLREQTAGLTAGAPLQVEMMAGVPTKAEVDGKLVRDYGSPEMAMAMLRLAALLQVVLTAAAVLYLWWKRRQEEQEKANEATSAPGG